MKNIRKKSIALVAGLAITGVVGASAASLNGINSESLGADTKVVGSCDTDGVTVAYNTSYAGSGVVGVNSVVVTAVNAACLGQNYEVELYDAADSSLGVSTPGTIGAPGTSFTAAFASPVDAELVEGIAITISG